MQLELDRKSSPVASEMSADIQKIMNEQNASPFMKLLWEQQKTHMQGKPNKYHPMIIRFCLSLASKSASAYDELRSSNIIKIPSRRTLRDYKNSLNIWSLAWPTLQLKE